MPFSRINGTLYADNIALSDIAKQIGTPCYVYVWSDVEARYQELLQALGEVDAAIRYAVKANSNLNLLRRFVALGSGFDVVSGGELERVALAGATPASVVFSGVGKSNAEIRFALKLGIGCFNIESSAEAHRIQHIAAGLGMQAPVAIRVNPDINVETHPYIATGMRENKFGVPESEAFELAQEMNQALSHLSFRGLACHIGSQVTDLQPYADSLDALIGLKQRLADVGIPCVSFDLGGGFGIRYENEEPLSFGELGQVLASRNLTDVALDIEPGRSLIAQAGVLLTRVEYLKPAPAPDYRNFCVVDAAMNDLMRPALYEAYHGIENVDQRDDEERIWQVVGPVCETGDFLANDRKLSVREGDLLAVRDVGAYGFVMSSNYNSRPRAAEVVVEGDTWQLARRRESMSDLLALENT